MQLARFLQRCIDLTGDIVCVVNRQERLHIIFHVTNFESVTQQNCIVLLSLCLSSASFYYCPPPKKHSIVNTATRAYRANEMVRFVFFIAVLLTLGVLGGPPLPATPEGE